MAFATAAGLESLKVVGITPFTMSSEIAACSPAASAESAAGSFSSPRFLAIQLALVVAVAGLVAWRYRSQPKPPVLPPLRSEPLAIGPRYDNPLVVTDEQLSRVLARLRPRLAGKETKIGSVDHALRFWTTRARFDDPAFASGETLRQILVDQQAFAGLYGAEERPLLVPEKHGVRVRTQDGQATSTHVDHTLASLAEVGTPLDFELNTPQGKRTFRAMIEQSLRDFSLNQVETEWSGLTYALFLPPARGWTTSEGQQVTFDMLARRLMRERFPRGVCFGNHRLFTLAVFLRVDETEHILSPNVRQSVIDFLKRQTAVLVTNQSPEGYWGADWARAEGAPAVEADATGDVVSDRVLATGHALEWWAIAPEECHPPRETLVRAGQWLVKAIDEMTDQQIQDRQTYLSHAGRALALWRKADPGNFKP
jgi:hypothetical protein